MPKAIQYKLGTLICDMGKIGVICRLIQTGKLQTEANILNWQFNYEIYYVDGTITIMGHKTLLRLIESNTIELLHTENIMEENISEI
jgi:MOSC domain-containing protein YiiM|tara:strand:+ start:952 stop:1212 length:261 start_codon:yes stop_codon:yes gene_type:complete